MSYTRNEFENIINSSEKFSNDFYIAEDKDWNGAFLDIIADFHGNTYDVEMHTGMATLSSYFFLPTIGKKDFSNIIKVHYDYQYMYFLIRAKLDFYQYEPLLLPNQNSSDENINYYNMKTERKKEMKNIGKELATSGLINFRSLGEYYLFDTLLKSVKQKYGEEILIYEGNSIYNVTKWIAEHDKKYNARPKFNKKDQLSDCQFIFKIDIDTYVFVQSGDYVYKFDLFSKGNNSEDSVCLRLYIFGKKYKKYSKEIYDIINNRTNNQILFLYNVKGGTDKDGDLKISSVAKYLPERSIDTLFLNNGYKTEILDHINAFLENRPLYESKNLIYKTGILLYGEPGTGKSSLALALANYYNRNLVTVDMGTFDRLDIPTLTMALNANPTEEFIVLLEDIDTLFSTLDREDKSIDKDERAVINKMLQFLDSTSSPNNVIFIATTNHIEKLDDAILRDGRFDIKINISNINTHTATKMCNSFNITDEDEIKTIINGCKFYGDGEDKKVNPAELQNKILKYIKEKKINEK